MSCLVGGLEHCNFSIYWEIKHHPTPPHPTPPQPPVTDHERAVPVPAEQQER